MFDCTVPQQGTLDIQTEFGFMEVRSGEICVIQRGIQFAVRLPDGPARGYVLEVFSGHFEIPSLGPIGMLLLALLLLLLLLVAACQRSNNLDRVRSVQVLMDWPILVTSKHLLPPTRIASVSGRW
jgi:homogentisate 1,2-dioxygenase